MRDATVFAEGDIVRHRDVSPFAELLTMHCEVE